MFNKRVGGMLMLYDLLASQPPDRARLLEEAPLSRAALSRRFDVSRAHVNAMLAEAGEAGLLSCPAPDRVVFSQRLSDAMERHYAQFIQLTRAAARVALATLPNRPPRDTLKAGLASL
jgi:non-ribosomal peptide synthetase component F